MAERGCNCPPPCQPRLHGERQATAKARCRQCRGQHDPPSTARSGHRSCCMTMGWIFHVDNSPRGQLEPEAPSALGKTLALSSHRQQPCVPAAPRNSGSRDRKTQDSSRWRLETWPLASSSWKAYQLPTPHLRAQKSLRKGMWQEDIRKTGFIRKGLYQVSD